VAIPKKLEREMVSPNRDLSIEEQAPLVLLPMTVWGEARGEPFLSKICVAHVIVNRSKKRRMSIKEVVLQPKQFSVFNLNDPNRDKLLLADSLEGEEVWGECVAASWVALVSREYDPTNGATHYYSGKRRPKWAKRMRETLTLGRLHFLRPG